MSDLSAKLAELQSNLVERMDENKKEFGATLERLEKGAISREEFEDRQRQAKESFASQDEVKELAKQVKDVAESVTVRNALRDPDPDMSYYRDASKYATDQESAGALLERFLRSEPQNDKVAELHRLTTRLSVIQTLGAFAASRTGKAYAVGASRDPDVRRMFANYRRLQLEVFPADFYKRAFDTQDTTPGAADWIPTMLSSDLLRYVEVRGSIIPNIRLFPMPAAKWDSPYVTAAGKAHGFKEQVDAPSAAINYTLPAAGALRQYTNNDAPAAKVAFDCSSKRFRSKLISTREFIESSIVPVLDFMIEDGGNAIRRAVEDAAINGDTDGTHYDAGISYTPESGSGALDCRTMLDGFRKTVHANSVTQAATSNHATIGNMVSLKTAMGRYGLEASEGLWVCGLRSYLDLLDLPELITMDKIGSAATMVTGQVGSLLGSPVVVSEYVREDLQSTGLYTTSTGNQTVMLYVHRPSWWIGQFRGITTEPERIPMFNQDVIWTWYAADMHCVRGTSEKTAGAIIDID